MIYHLNYDRRQYAKGKRETNTNIVKENFDLTDE
jgi:hypothetical protein